MRKAIATIYASLAWISPVGAVNESDVTTPPKSEAALSPTEVTDLLKSPLVAVLKQAPAFSYSSEELKAWADRAKKIHSSAPVKPGDPKVKYDVIVQIGHYPRKTGITGGQGKYVTEQQMAALVAVGIAQNLNKMQVNEKPISYLLVGAVDYVKGLTSRIFLSLHTDLSAVPCRVGPSVGYEQVGDAKGMHGIALALALTLGINAEKFMSDNYTKALSGFYAYRDFKTTDFKGVLEMSELTCLQSEERLLASAAALATNLAVAIQFALR